MLNPLFAASGLLLLLAAPAVAPEPSAWHGAVALLQQQHVTIHVPRVTITSTTIIMRSTPVAPPRLPPVREKKASDCVKIDRIVGFAVNTTDSVDLVLTDSSLLRAKLGSECPALGFYQGFYVKPTEDKKLCAGRDSLRSRSGRSCGIQAFRTLVAAR